MSTNHCYLQPRGWIAKGSSSTVLAQPMWKAPQWLLPNSYVMHIITDLVKFVNNSISQELRPINGQCLSHMCTSVNPNTNHLGLMNYQSVVLTFDMVSYRANWYSLTLDTDPPNVSFHKHKIFASDLYGWLQRLTFSSPF